MIIQFTIYGNQEDPEGNPIPYVRSTQKALWRRDWKRYAAWKEFVQKRLIVSNLGDQITFIRDNLWSLKKPLIITGKARMDLKIFWKKGTHGDPDNIFKGIADALFVDDRNLDGSFESSSAEDGKGRVEVIINVNDQKTNEQQGRKKTPTALSKRHTLAYYPRN